MEVPRVAENEDKTFDMLKEIKGGKKNGEKLKKITTNHSGDRHEFYFGKEDDADEGAVVIFSFDKIRDENKINIKDGEFDLGKIKILQLSNNAVELLPMLKIDEENKMALLAIFCSLKPDLGKLLGREKKICIGSVDTLQLSYYAINLLTKIETKKGSEMKRLEIPSGSLRNIDPLLESGETLCLGKIKNIDLGGCENDGTEKKIKEIFGARNNERNSWEIRQAITTSGTGSQGNVDQNGVITNDVSPSYGSQGNVGQGTVIPSTGRQNNLSTNTRRQSTRRQSTVSTNGMDKGNVEKGNVDQNGVITNDVSTNDVSQSNVGPNDVGPNDVSQGNVDPNDVDPNDVNKGNVDPNDVDQAQNQDQEQKQDEGKRKDMGLY
ncbi:MAG: uncharacterized protein A8A55_0072 [Amphiamblys sp. WSBS2006]|nr:MAG: uncharacterized protein A8A55_0072 [Amphiamblys sp. WSBS2006]